MRFQEAASTWYNKKSLRWKEGSRAKYAMILRKYFLPEFGNVNLCEIGSNSIQKFAENKLCGLSPTTKKFILATLSQILKGALPAECFGKIEFPNSGEPERREAASLSPGESAELIAALERNADVRLTNSALCILLAALTGMRLGELCALRTFDFDFGQSKIHICTTRERLPVEDSDDSVERTTQTRRTSLKTCPTKSVSGTRDVPIPARLIPSLKKEMRNRAADAFLVRCDPRTLQNHFKKFLKLAGLPNVRFHTLRHTYATHAIAAGAELKTLSALLGHASTHTTLDLYVHPTFESKCEVQRSFLAFVLRGKEKKPHRTLAMRAPIWDYGGGACRGWGR